MTHDTLHETPPWTWPEAQWRRRVDQVRAGRSLRPQSWPGGARCAVALSFDSDHETNELRDGGKSIGRMSWGQYGNRVGVPRVLALLAKTGIPATFFVPAVTALLYPLCSTFSGASSTAPMPRAVYSCSPCIPTSSATARGCSSWKN